VYTIAFSVGASSVPGDANTNLRALAARMAKDSSLRVELVAYASDPEKIVSRSRRLSTERGVNVRRELLAAGVESTRINLRALGEQSGTGAPDRVDVLLVRR
jgi:outer membrane protein OmpA-like peptidoglycan-associated protein